MAERRTSVRLAVVGGNEVRAELMAIGADGQRSLEGIGRGAQSAGAGLRLLDGNAAAARQQIAHLRGQTGNLAAQFQDIGVQLAGGQSPFLIALQQGGQISQVLGPAGARGAVAALGAAFASLVNPVSLATIGIIAAGGAAFQYFSTLLGDGRKSAEELEHQAAQIGQVAQKWGNAVPALRAYVDELERAQSVEARTAAVEASLEDLAGRQVERFEELYESIRNVVALVPDAQREFGVLAGEVRSGVATSEDFERVIRALAAAMGDQAVPEIERAIGVIATMRDETAATAAEMANLAAQATTAASRIGQVFTGGGSMAPVQRLKRGDLLHFDYASNPTRRALHRMVENATANASGVTGSFGIRPFVRAGTTTGLAVTLIKPAAKMIVEPGSFDPGTAGRAFVTGMSFRAIEVR